MANDANEITEINSGLTLEVMGDVMQERLYQYLNHGVQNLSDLKWLSLVGEEFGEMCQALQADDPWSKDSDKHSLYPEIIQCAAVLIQWAETIKQQTGRE